MDKETVIKGCEYWVNNHKDENFLLTYSSVVELLDVLKGHESVRPVKQIEQTEWTVCGNCHNHIISKWIFCPYCGKAIEWE